VLRLVPPSQSAPSSRPAQAPIITAGHSSARAGARAAWWGFCVTRWPAMGRAGRRADPIELPPTVHL